MPTHPLMKRIQSGRIRPHLLSISTCMDICALVEGEGFGDWVRGCVGR